MKKRLITFILLTVLALIIYSIFFVFVFDMSLSVQYILPFSVLIMLFIALLICLGLFNNCDKTNKKISDKLLILEKLNNYLITSNKTIINDLSVGILSYSKDFSIEFVNKFAKVIFQSDLLGKKVKFVFPDLLPYLENNESNFVLSVYGKTYRVLNNSEEHTAYFFDNTGEAEIKEKFDETKPSIVILLLQNLNQALSNMDLERRTEVLGKYYLSIEKWREKFGIFALSASNDKQLFVINNNTLKLLEEDQFSILQEIDDISRSLELEISLSIGLGTGSLDYKTLGFYAEEALNLASNRGGDQAVVNDGTKTVAYGGYMQFTEKKSKTTAKIICQKLVKEIENVSAVVIMPHINSDADALGSALGMLCLCESLNTPAKILIDYERVDSTVEKIISNSRYEYIKLQQSLITEDELADFFKGKTLLIVVDHHEEKLSMSKSVYKMASEIAIIDHHRLTYKLEINAPIQYIDHNSSSAVELVTELIDLAPLKVNIPPYVATIMLTGMMIDTQNFSSHVDSRTFQAASFLTERGADSYKAKMLLREPINEQVSRAKLLEKVEVLYNKYAIIVDNSGVVTREHLAKMAQSLLDIENIVAGFAIGLIDKETINISGRSNGNFSVHSLMEQFGGGGHFSIGAAQIAGSTLDDVKYALSNKLSVSNANKEGEMTMKIILIEDVKKQGKKGDIIEVAPGYANFLLSKKLAVEANPSNISALEEEKANLKHHLQEEFEVANKLKSILDKTVVKLHVKVGQGGKVFGSISSKQIADELESQHNIVVDKKKLILPEEKISALGTHQIIAKLNKDITSTFTIEVVEERGE